MYISLTFFLCAHILEAKIEKRSAKGNLLKQTMHDIDVNIHVCMVYN